MSEKQEVTREEVITTVQLMEQMQAYVENVTQQLRDIRTVIENHRDNIKILDDRITAIAQMELAAQNLNLDRILAIRKILGGNRVLKELEKGD